MLRCSHLLPPVPPPARPSPPHPSAVWHCWSVRGTASPWRWSMLAPQANNPSFFNMAGAQGQRRRSFFFWSKYLKQKPIIAHTTSLTALPESNAVIVWQILASPQRTIGSGNVTFTRQVKNLDAEPVLRYSIIWMSFYWNHRGASMGFAFTSLLSVFTPGNKESNRSDFFVLF